MPNRGPIGGHCCVLFACPTMLVDQGRDQGVVCARDTLRDRVAITGRCARDTLWDCRTEVHLIWEALLCLACVPHNVGPRARALVITEWRVRVTPCGIPNQGSFDLGRIFVSCSCTPQCWRSVQSEKKKSCGCPPRPRTLRHGRSPRPRSSHRDQSPTHARARLRRLCRDHSPTPRVVSQPSTQASVIASRPHTQALVIAPRRFSKVSVIVSGQSPKPQPLCPHPGFDHCVTTIHPGLDDCVMTIHPGFDHCVTTIHQGFSDCVMTTHPGPKHCVTTIHPGPGQPIGAWSWDGRRLVSSNNDQHRDTC